MAPGFAIGFLTNVLSFREERIIGKFLISVILSISIFPIIYYWILRFTHVALIWVIVGGSLGIVIYYYVNSFLIGRKKINISAKVIQSTIGLLFFWTFLAFLLIDFEVDSKLFSSLMSYDYVKHTAVTDTISRSGIPPANPSFYPGAALDLFYYYFWFVFASLVDQLGGELITPRHSIFAGILWFSTGLVAITWLFVNKFGKIVIPDIKRKYYPLLISMLAITGLDLLPILSHKVLEYVIGMHAYSVPSIEWWNEQIASWFSSIVWVPHHLSALVATLFVFVLIRECVDEAHTRGKKRLLIIFASLALPPAFGMSIWVSLVFFSFLLVWFLFSLYRGYKKEATVLFTIGVLSMVFVAPYVLDLHGASYLNKAPVIPSIRPFFITDELVYRGGPVVMQIARLFFPPH